MTRPAARRRPAAAAAAPADLRPRVVAAFLAGAVVLWAVLFAAAETWVRHTADQNPVHRIRAAPEAGTDWIVLGASHALPLDFGGFGEEIAAATGLRILNLAAQGTGPLYHRFLAERFFAARRARGVLVVADSFAFDSPKWNEDRFGDRDLLARTPLDGPALGLYARFLRYGVDPRALIDYATGFSKINDRDRLKPDRWEGADRFDRTARPSAQADRDRIAYLHPGPPDPAAQARYLDHLSALVAVAQAAGARVTVIKPPLPARFAALLPDQAIFDAALTARLSGLGVPLHDFTAVLPDPAFYFDPDHLNRAGARAFLEGYLGALLIEGLAPEPAAR